MRFEKGAGGKKPLEFALRRLFRGCSVTSFAKRFDGHRRL